MKTLLKSFLRVVIVVFVLLQIIGITCIDWLMFHPEMIRETYDEKTEGYVNVGTAEEPIAAVVLGPTRGAKAILHCHGNAESMVQSIEVLRELVQKGFTVAAVDYPGYGLSSGRPTEKGCYRNVHRLYDWLIEKRGFAPEDIIVSGFSIGTGSAVELAATKPVGGLVLGAPFLSAPRAVTRVRLLPIDPFPNAQRVFNVIACPMLIFHGTDDHVVPFAQGEELARISKNRNWAKDDVEQRLRWYREFVPVEGADHGEVSAVLGVDKYLDKVADFAKTICTEKRKTPEPPGATGDLNAYWASLWSWRDACNPFLAGIVFGGVVVVVMIFIRRRQVLREKRLARERCRQLAKELEGKRVESLPKEREKLDKPIHIETKTMPLDLKKMVKTGAPYDKGGMG